MASQQQQAQQQPQQQQQQTPPPYDERINAIRRALAEATRAVSVSCRGGCVAMQVVLTNRLRI